MAVRTWAPQGQTPILTVPLTHDHLAAISGITPAGRLFMQTQERAYHADDVVRFLRLLLRKVRGKLLVIWDGAPIHRGQPVKDFLRRGAARRLHLEQLPAYAPELNPDEVIWNYLEARRTGQPVLPRPGGVDHGAASGQGAAAPQARSYPGLHHTGGLPCLAFQASVRNRMVTLMGGSCSHTFHRAVS